MSHEDPAISRVDVFPDYGRGFVFHWEVAGGFEDRGPWQFLVQFAPSPVGEWRDMSPVLENVSAWRCNEPIRTSKESVLFFRLLMRTPDDIYESSVVTPYGDLGRRDFLVGRDVMRIESLHLRKASGVEIDIWSISGWGPKCDCRDPVTGHVMDSHCRKCFGTGYMPGYRGPFRTWGGFSTDAQHKVEQDQQGENVDSRKAFELKLVASIPVKKHDAVRDCASGKWYYVDSVSVTAEVRRVPLLQTAVVFEAPITDVIYSLR